MNLDELVIGKRYLMFHYEWKKTFWPIVYKYIGPNSRLSNVKEFEIVSDIYTFSVGCVISFGHGGIGRWMNPYSDDLFEYYGLFQT